MAEMSITLDSSRLDAQLGALVARISNMTPLMSDIAELLLLSTKRRFASGEDPDGNAWLPLKDGSGRHPLVLTGTMRDQIFAGSSSDFAEVSASAKQAPWHQFGVDPYQIETKNFGFVTHPGIPARPFLGLSDADETGILLLAAAYVDLSA